MKTGATTYETSTPMNSRAVVVFVGLSYLLVGLGFSYLDRRYGSFELESVLWLAWAVMGFGTGLLHTGKPASKAAQAQWVVLGALGMLLAIFPGFVIFNLLRWASIMLMIVVGARAAILQTRRDFYLTLTVVFVVSFMVATHESADWTLWIYLGPAWVCGGLALAWDHAANASLPRWLKLATTLGFLFVALFITSVLFLFAPRPDILGFGFLPPGTETPGRFKQPAGGQGDDEEKGEGRATSSAPTRGETGTSSSSGNTRGQGRESILQNMPPGLEAPGHSQQAAEAQGAGHEKGDGPANSTAPKGDETGTPSSSDNNRGQRREAILQNVPPGSEALGHSQQAEGGQGGDQKRKGKGPASSGAPMSDEMGTSSLSGNSPGQRWEAMLQKMHDRIDSDRFMPTWQRGLTRRMLEAGQSMMIALGLSDVNPKGSSSELPEREKQDDPKPERETQGDPTVPDQGSLLLWLLLLLVAILIWRRRYRIGLFLTLGSAWLLAFTWPKLSMRVSALSLKWCLHVKGHHRAPGQSVREHWMSATTLAPLARRWLRYAIEIYCGMRFGGLAATSSHARQMQEAVRGACDIVMGYAPELNN